MPAYDYRCENCGTRFDLFFKTYADYDAATPHCPNCDSLNLKRIISGIQFKQPARDFTGMSSGEMLSVLESGDSRAVGEMFQQVGAGDPSLGKEYHDTTERLLDGDSVQNVESDLRKSDADSKTKKSETKPEKKPKSDQ